MAEKKYLLKKEDIKPLIEWEGEEGCLATDTILVKGKKVGYMYRDTPAENAPDSGWRFMAGDESDSYMNNPENIGVYSLNTICNYDKDIIPFLNSPIGTAYFRDEKGVFQKEEFDPEMTEDEEESTDEIVKDKE